MHTYNAQQTKETQKEKVFRKKISLSEKEYFEKKLSFRERVFNTIWSKKNSQLLDAVERQLLALEVQGLLIEFEEVDSFLQVLALKEGPASRADL